MNTYKLAAAVLSLQLALTVNAALLITNNDDGFDKDANTYTYRLTVEDLALPGSGNRSSTSGGKFFDDISSVSNITQWNTDRNFITASSISLASFEYTFDFSQTDYYVTSVQLTDVALIMAGESASARITVDYKIGDGAWTNLQTLAVNQGTAKTHPSINFISAENPDGVSSFTYRVIFSDISQPGSSAPAQWGRTNPATANATAFAAVFTTVGAPIPEPTTSAILASLVCLLFVAVYRLKKRS